MTEQSFPPDAEYRPGVNVTEYCLPACWEDMEYLGLNPVTGEPMEDAA